jgi:hypothetical protein
MNTCKFPNQLTAGVILLWTFTIPQAFCLASSPIEGPQNQEANRKILVEIFLSPDQKKNLEKIRNELKTASINRMNIQFFRLGHPPQNIAIGGNIAASTARLAIRMAATYNSGVKFLLPQYRFPPDYIAIGTSAFDESSQIPILPEDLERLENDALTTTEFHTLYRSLTGEEKRPPTYLE